MEKCKHCGHTDNLFHVGIERFCLDENTPGSTKFEPVEPSPSVGEVGPDTVVGFVWSKMTGNYSIQIKDLKPEFQQAILTHAALVAELAEVKEDRNFLRVENAELNYSKEALSELLSLKQAELSQVKGERDEWKKEARRREMPPVIPEAKP